MASPAEVLASKLEEGASSYGAVRGFVVEARKEKAKVGPLLVVGCVFVPWVLFFATFWAMSFWLRYSMSSAAYGVAALTFACCAVTLGMTIQAARGKGGDPLWLGLLFGMSALGWTWGFFGGNLNYQTYMQPYYDLSQLNVYESIDPTTSRGNQYMDAGILGFSDTTTVDRSYAMSFKDDDMYCVAPIAVPNATKPEVYDFWAVGKNCCNQHLFNFHCGEYNNPAAHTGVRLMDANEEQLYQIVVKQAAAAYSLPMAHPIMFNWVSDPTDMVDGYQEDAMKCFIREAFYWFCIEIGLVVLAAVVFSKL